MIIHINKTKDNPLYLQREQQKGVDDDQQQFMKKNLKLIPGCRIQLLHQSVNRIIPSGVFECGVTW